MTDSQESPCGKHQAGVFLKPDPTCQKADGSWYFKLSVQTLSFLSGIIDVVAFLHLTANRKLTEQACCDYIL